MNIKEIVFEEIKKTFGITEISEDMNIYDDLALSSLDALEMIGKLEERLNIEIDEEVLGEVSTLEDFIQAIEKECEGK
jgi:acyl carrier protein